MVLQYKGFNNNWVYEEAETVTSAVVWVGKETRDYRKGGIRYEKKYENLHGREVGEIDLSYVKEMHEAVDKIGRASCRERV